MAIRDDLTRGETAYLDVLTDLIEKHEDIRYPGHDVLGVELLRFLMSERGKPQAEVARELGISPSTISEILTGKRDFGRKYIEAFSHYFCVSPATFLARASNKYVRSVRRNRRTARGVCLLPAGQEPPRRLLESRMHEPRRHAPADPSSFSIAAIARSCAARRLRE